MRMYRKSRLGAANAAADREIQNVGLWVWPIPADARGRERSRLKAAPPASDFTSMPCSIRRLLTTHESVSDAVRWRRRLQLPCTRNREGNADKLLIQIQLRSDRYRVYECRLDLTALMHVQEIVSRMRSASRYARIMQIRHEVALDV